MEQNEIVSYREMCAREQASLQHGMNFCSTKRHSVLLTSLRSNAPYDDRLEDNGTTLIYEGHDVPKKANQPDPKTQDQQLRLASGTFTANGRFHEAAQGYKRNGGLARRVRVYEKIKDGIWSYNGLFLLVDSWFETSKARQVLKLKLSATRDLEDDVEISDTSSQRRRLIPSLVKLEVWKRDNGRCVHCGSMTELHFDHILPYSRGGTSNTADNIQLLCMRHNLQKSARIE